MDSKNARARLEQFSKNWTLQQQYYIWGASNTARKLCGHMDCLKIEGFLDSDPQKWGTQFLGRPVFAPEDALKKAPIKIIVASQAYSEIRLALESKGLRENIDFCDSRAFLSANLWREKKLVYISRTDVSITSYCNLRCKDCNMLMPYYKRHAHYDTEQILADADAYFRWVDFVEIFHLLGGEPFLHPQVLEITRTIAERYRAKMGELVFFTNGTILPERPLLELMHEYNIKAYIGDYRLALPAIRPKVDALIETLKTYGVAYETAAGTEWSDFNHTPTDRGHWSDERLAAVCRNCNPPFRGLHDKKFYYCHLSTSAALAGRVPESPWDCFDLSGPEEGRKEELVAFDLGYIPKGYVSYCRYCGGCGPANTCSVPIAEQL